MVATDHADIARRWSRRAQAVMTRADHPRLPIALPNWRESTVCAAEIVVQYPGRRPLIDPAPSVKSVAASLQKHREAAIATACHPLRSSREFVNPNVVKVVLDKDGYALYFSRAPIPYPRDAMNRATSAGLRRLPVALPAYRHIGLYAYRGDFLQRFKRLAPEPWSSSKRSANARARPWLPIRVSRPRGGCPGVDTPADLALVRVASAYRRPLPVSTSRRDA